MPPDAELLSDWLITKKKMIIFLWIEIVSRPFTSLHIFFILPFRSILRPKKKQILFCFFANTATSLRSYCCRHETTALLVVVTLHFLARCLFIDWCQLVVVILNFFGYVLSSNRPWHPSSLNTLHFFGLVPLVDWCQLVVVALHFFSLVLSSNGPQHPSLLIGVGWWLLHFFLAWDLFVDWCQLVVVTIHFFSLVLSCNRPKRPSSLIGVSWWLLHFFLAWGLFIDWCGLVVIALHFFGLVLYSCSIKT